MTRFAIFFASLLLLVSCRPKAIETMAHATKQIDTQYSAAYQEAAKACLERSGNWKEYDACMDPWETGADAVRALHATTLALDVADNKTAFKGSACAWYRAVAVVDAVSPVELPAASTALASSWRRKC